MRTYIAGPMRGYPEFNFPAFDQAEQYLADHVTFSPATRDRNKGFDPTGLTGNEDLAELGFDLHDAMAADLRWITTHAEQLVMLPGWSKSQGALHEKATAELCGLGVRYFLPEHGGALVDYPHVKDQPIPTEDEFIAAFTDAYQASGCGEVRVTNPTTGGAKGAKPERYDLIPVAPLAELARVYGFGATKYASRNWERGYDWSLSYAALQRHANAYWSGETHDPETGLHHLAHAIFHCMAPIEWATTHPELDDRPTTHHPVDPECDEPLPAFAPYAYDKVTIEAPEWRDTLSTPHTVDL